MENQRLRTCAVHSPIDLRLNGVWLQMRLGSFKGRQRQAGFIDAPDCRIDIQRTFIADRVGYLRDQEYIRETRKLAVAEAAGLRMTRQHGLYGG